MRGIGTRARNENIFFFARGENNMNNRNILFNRGKGSQKFSKVVLDQGIDEIHTRDRE